MPSFDTKEITMIFKIPRFIIRTLTVIAVILLVYCAFSGIKPISYEKDEDGSSISIAGNEIPIEGSELLDAYNDAEKRASALIPKKLRAALERISELLKLN